MKLWIARQKWGGLFLFGTYPYKNEDENWGEEEWKSPISGLSFQIDDESFPEVTFENSPQEVKLVFCNHIDTINIQDCDPRKQPCILTNHGIETNVIFK